MPNLLLPNLNAHANVVDDLIYATRYLSNELVVRTEQQEAVGIELLNVLDGTVNALSFVYGSFREAVEAEYAVSQESA